MPDRRRFVIVGLLAAAILGGAPRVASGLAAAALVADEPVDWVACGPGRECTTMSVPADHADPNGARLSIRVGRVPAGDPSRRIGSLFVNPGGPGASAVDALVPMAESLPRAVTDRFDVVAVDPRGVGRSAPVDCDVPLDPVFDRSFQPTTDQARHELEDALRTVADACATRHGERLFQVSTADSARDLDIVRERLGEERLSFLGFSYGTYLGALYAAMFPSQVRAMVLDGAVDPGTDARDATVAQAHGFEEGLDRFLEWCSVHRACAFARDGDPGRAYDALRARIAAEPLVVDPDATGDSRDTRRVLNDTRFDAAVLLHLYQGKAAWLTLATALAEADAGNGERLLRGADSFFGREPGGDDDGLVEAFWAVGCLDDPTSGAVGLQQEAEAVAPRLGAFVANFSLACAVWPTRDTPVTEPRFDDAAPHALVVGTTSDPATPLADAEGLARLLGDAPLVVVTGSRHTAVGSGNACVDRAARRALVTPRAPAPARRRC